MAKTSLIALSPDGGAAELLTCPFAVGEAPFRIKGNAYRGHLDFVEKHLTGGLAAQAEAFRTLSPQHGGAWAEYFEQTFMSSAWYDTYPLAVAGIACGLVEGETFLEFAYRRSCVQARQDIRGIYKWLLKFVSAKQIALRVPGLVGRYFDFGKVECSVEDAITIRTEFTGVPSALWPWMTQLVSAYITTVIEITGKEAPTVVITEAETMGEEHGQPMCRAAGIVKLAHIDPDSMPPAGTSVGPPRRTLPS